MAAAAEATARPQDAVVRREFKQPRDWWKAGLGVYFVLFLFFLYLPMILMAILSFQGSTGQLTFPFRGPISLDWWKTLFDANVFNTISDDVSASGRQSLWLAIVAGILVAAFGFSLSMAFRRRWRLKGDVIAFYILMLALMTPAFLVGLGNQLLWRYMGETPSLWYTALGANVIWGIPFSFLVMLAVWNRYDRHIEEAARDLGANSTTTFREVTLPLVWTGIFGSFLFGFTLAWNDFDRTILLQNGYQAQPLPILIGTWPSSRPILPNLYALGAGTTAVTLFLIFIVLVIVNISLRFRSHRCTGSRRNSGRKSSASSMSGRPPSSRRSSRVLPGARLAPKPGPTCRLRAHGTPPNRPADRIGSNRRRHCTSVGEWRYDGRSRPRGRASSGSRPTSRGCGPGRISTPSRRSLVRASSTTSPWLPDPRCTGSRWASRTSSIPMTCRRHTGRRSTPATARVPTPPASR